MEYSHGLHKQKTMSKLSKSRKAVFDSKLNASLHPSAYGEDDSESDSTDEQLEDQNSRNEQKDLLAFEDIEAQKKSIDQQMKDFVSQNCVQRDLPAIYYQDAKFIPVAQTQNESFAVMIINKVLPEFKSQTFLIDSYYQDGTLQDSLPINEAFKHDNFGKASLMLFRIEKDGIKATPIHILPLENVQRARIQFSDDGKLMLLYYKPFKSKNIGDDISEAYSGRGVNKELDRATEELKIFKMPTEINESTLIKFFNARNINREECPSAYHFKQLKKDLRFRFDPTGRFILLYKQAYFKVIDLKNVDKWNMNLLENDKILYPPKFQEDGLSSKKNSQLFLNAPGKAKNDIKEWYHYIDIRTNDYLFNYSQILDARILSDEQHMFKVVIALQSKFQNRVDFIAYYGKYLGNHGVLEFEIDNYEEQLIQGHRKLMFLTYEQKLDKLQVAISEDLTQAVLLADKESYMLQLEQNKMDKDTDYHQLDLEWLDNKVVYSIMTFRKHFLFVCSQSYDDDIKIMSSWDAEFEHSVGKRVEPNVINVMDFQINIDISKLPVEPKLVDEEGIIEHCEMLTQHIRAKYILVKGKDVNFDFPSEERSESTSLPWTSFMGVSVNWPFLVYQGIENRPHCISLWIINVNDQASFIRLKIENECQISRLDTHKYSFQLAQSFITDSYELVLLCSDQNQKYSMFNCDLSDLIAPKLSHKAREQVSQVQPLGQSFKMPNDDHTSIEDIHVRSEDVKNNLKGMYFFRTTKALYQWNSQDSIPVPLISVADRSIKRLSDDEFVVIQKQYHKKQSLLQTAIMSKIKEQNDDVSEENFEDAKEQILFFTKLELGFNEATHSRIQTPGFDTMQTKTTRGLAFDSQSMIVITLVRIGSHHFIKIIDLNEDQILWEGKVINKELIGRLKSNLYKLINGHLYYSNKCIKVRYDLLQDQHLEELEEDQVFNFYDDLSLLKDNEIIQSTMPLVSQNSHRLFYMTDNIRSFKQGSRLIITPYLHERKIYHQEMEEQQKCYYHVLNSNMPKPLFNVLNIDDEDPDNSVLNQMFKNGVLYRRSPMKEILDKYGTPKAVSASGQGYIFEKQLELENKTILSILLLSIDEFFLVKQIDIKEDILNYMQEYKNNNQLSQFFANKSKSSIYFKDQPQAELKPNRLYKDNDHELDVVEQYVADGKLNPPVKVSINDNLDVLLQFDIVRDDLEYNNKEADQDTPQFFFMQKSAVNFEKLLDQEYQDLDKLKEFVNNLRLANTDFENPNVVHVRYQQFIVTCKMFEQTLEDPNQYFFKKQTFLGSCFNEKYAIFFSPKMISYIELSNIWKGFNRLGFEIANTHEEQQFHIKRIQSGSFPFNIAIILNQSREEDLIIIWDCSEDTEVNGYQTSTDAVILWDHYGYPYISEEDKVIVAQQGVTLKCYPVQEIYEKDQKYKLYKQLFVSEQETGYEYGHRFDPIKHEWIYMRDYVCLSHSYMTLVMRNKFRDGTDYEFMDLDENQMDLEMLNFVIDRKTIFTEDPSLMSDHEKLQKILQYLESLDDELLSQIQYYYELNHQAFSNLINHEAEGQTFVDDKIAGKEVEMQQRKCMKLLGRNANFKMGITPLHIAVEKKTFRSVKTLLEYMAKLSYNNSNTFKDILPELVNYKGFVEYMGNLPFCTMQMEEKLSLKVQDSDFDQIVRVRNSKSSYVDSRFFENQMEEEKLHVNKKSDGQEHFQKSVLGSSYHVRIESLKIKWLLEQDGHDFLEEILNSESYDLYQISSIQSVIQYLWKIIRVQILIDKAPYYFLQLLSFLAMTYNYEQNKFVEKVDATQGVMLVIRSTYNNDINVLLVILNLYLSFFQLYELLKNEVIKSKGIPLLSSSFFWVDVICTILNCFISIVMLNDVGVQQNIPRSGFAWFRVMVAIVSILIWIRFLYFMQLIDGISPLIAIIVRIFADIAYFMVIFIVMIVAFANAFYLVGQNQKQFDNILPTQYPMYSKSFIQAIQYMYLLALGEFLADKTVFFAGTNPSQGLWLWIFFFISTILILVHFLNMLIAIMSETLANDNERKTESTYKEHLKFIVNNWHLIPNRKQYYTRLDKKLYLNQDFDYEDPFTTESGCGICCRNCYKSIFLDDDKSKNFDKVNYLVTAFLHEEEEEEVEVLNQLVEESNEMKEQSAQDLEDILFQVKRVRKQIRENQQLYHED